MTFDDILGLLPLLIFLLIVFSGFARRRPQAGQGAPPPPRPVEPSGEGDDVREILRELFGDRTAETPSGPARTTTATTARSTTPKVGAGPSTRTLAPARPKFGPASLSALSLEVTRLEARKLEVESEVTSAARRARDATITHTAPDLQIERLSPTGVEPARAAGKFSLDGQALIAAVVLGESMARRRKSGGEFPGERRVFGTASSPTGERPVRPDSREGRV